MRTMLVRWPCCFGFGEIESHTTCKHCKGKGYIQHWLSQEIGELLVRVDPGWYTVVDRRDDDFHDRQKSLPK